MSKAGTGASLNSDAIRRGVRAWIRKTIAANVLAFAILFGTAGRWDWVQGWVYFGILVAGQAANGLLLIPRNPELIALRTRLTRAVGWWDTPIVIVAAVLAPAAIWVGAGFDARHGSALHVPIAAYIVAVALAIAGYALLIWAMASNPFFIPSVRIQEERGHKVVTAGPYRYIRHPGYAGWVPFLILTPLLLGSRLAVIPAGIAAALFVLRTYLEDRALKRELPGYAEYAERVRSRLAPGVW